MTIGAISTAVLAGVIVFLLMIGLKKIARNIRSGSCCSADGASQGCQGCHGCHGCHGADTPEPTPSKRSA